MVSVVQAAESRISKCKHKYLLYMHSMIPIICAAIFAGYYHISRWELATKISAYSGSAGRCVPVSDRHWLWASGCSDRKSGRALSAFVGNNPISHGNGGCKLGFLMICAFWCNIFSVRNICCTI